MGIRRQGQRWPHFSVGKSGWSWRSGELCLPEYRLRLERPRNRLWLRREFAGRGISARRQSVWDRRHGRQRLGMVSRLLRAISPGTKNKSARTNYWRQACLPRRKLEIALQQSANDGPRLECAEFFVQRSRIPDRLRVRLRSAQYRT